MLAAWQRKAEGADDPLARAAYGVLVRLAGAILIQHGRLRGERTFLAALAAELTCNEHGSELIGRLIEPHVREAAAREGYRVVPAQLNAGGHEHQGRVGIRQEHDAAAATAAGGGTRAVLERLRRDQPGHLAQVPPRLRDLWAMRANTPATLTGHELTLIDQKLDRYMAQKAEQFGMSHLLIDRFRFDSFALDPDEEEGSRLLTRFGRLVYMFFMITPPEATVERAWMRGRQVGRYKAVDDLLAHNVEAYTGMPRLFFTWAAKKDKTVHYEFLDNDVPEGERPRTVAFGANGEMNILDIKRLIDVERYRKINVDARRPEDVYPDARAMAPERNLDFLLECTRRIPAINFVERDTGRVYARIESGQMSWADPAAFEKALDDPDARAGLLAVAPSSIRRGWDQRNAPPDLIPDRVHTLGRWGPARH